VVTGRERFGAGPGQGQVGNPVIAEAVAVLPSWASAVYKLGRSSPPKVPVDRGRWRGLVPRQGILGRASICKSSNDGTAARVRGVGLLRDLADRRPTRFQRFRYQVGNVSKIAFLFPGQGAQTVGMAGPFVEVSPRARELFDQAAEVLGYDLLSLCQRGPSERLDSTEFSQPALFVSSLAAVEVLRQQAPDVVMSCQGAAGLSLGEYTAMVFAGVMSFEDGLRVVQVRGRAMQAAADAHVSGMVSVLGLEREQVEAVCQQARDAGQVLQLANLLCPGNIAISGHADACERAAQLANQAGAMKTVPLAVAGAFHTPLMATAVQRLEEVLGQIDLQRPEITVVSNVDAQPHWEPGEIRELLIQQVCSKVLWEDSMRFLLDAGYDQFYEVGPGRVLRGLMKRIDRKVSCRGVLD